MKGIGFDAAQNTNGTTLTDLQQAGVQYQYTQPDGPYSMYQIDGHNVYVPGGTGNLPGDLNPAAQAYLAARSDPYMNPDALAGYAFTGTPYGGLTYTAPGSTAGAASGTAAGTQANRDALALIQQTLKQYGLPDSLADWAWQELVAGKGSDEVLIDLQQRPEFKAEFPEIDARLKAGLAPLSPSNIVSYRQQARQLMQAAGLPQGFYDSKDDFTKYLVGDTSLKELGDRVSIAAQALYGNPQDLAESRRLGFTDGEAVAQILNPDVAQPLIEKRWAAAQLSSAGVSSGYGGLSADEALGLAGQGVTQQQAQQGFGQLQQDQQLFNPLDAGENQITRQEQLSGAFGGNQYAQQRIADRAARRKAQFSGGGSYAGAQSGLTGLGGSSN